METTEAARRGECDERPEYDFDLLNILVGVGGCYMRCAAVKAAMYGLTIKSIGCREDRVEDAVFSCSMHWFRIIVCLEI